MIEIRFSYLLSLLRIPASVIITWGLITVAYSQNSMYSNPFLISTDTSMISTMAASTLDKNGYLHIAYVGWYGEPGAPDGVASEIFYTNNLSGEFKVPEKLPEAELPFSALFEDDFYYSKEPSIAVDSNGAVHVAYYRTEMQLEGSSWICYTNNTSGVFSVPQILYYDSLDWYSKYNSLGRHIMLAAGHDNDSIHIVFTGNSGTGHGGARYSAGLNGKFQKPITITQRSERPTINIDNEGIPNIVYGINSDTTDAFSDMNLATSKILGGQFTSPSILFEFNSIYSGEHAFAFDQNDSICVVFRHVSGVAGATQMHYVKGKNGQYTAPAELPTHTGVSLMYAIGIGNNQTEYIAYKQAADHQSLGFLFNDGSGFEDISPTDYNKYGFMSAGPQWFTYNNKNNMASFVYTTSQIYLVVCDLSTPSSPSGISPPNNATNVALAPTINWHISDRASSYNLQVSTSPDFSSILLDENNIIDTYTTVSGLSSNTTYYWKISATNAGGTSEWSETWNFTTVPAIPDIPTLSNPSDSAIDQDLTLTLSWNTSSRAESYTLQVSMVNDFSSTILNDSGITSTSKEISGLTNNTTYYWKVRATNAGGTSEWSETCNFTTINPVDINDFSSKTQFQLFPNPVVNSVLIMEGFESENAKITILSMDGKLLKQINYKGNNQIDLSDMHKGTYLLKISNSKTIYIKKIIIQ